VSDRPASDPMPGKEPGPDDQADRDVLEQMREQLASVSASDIVAEAAVPLVTLAYVRLGLPPNENERYRDLEAARLLIDALAGLLDGVQGRLGAVEAELRKALADLQLGYSDVLRHQAAQGQGGPPGGEPPAPPPEPPQEPPPSGQRPSGLWVPGEP
jgi:Domain of unknown function (DUF1844)